MELKKDATRAFGVIRWRPGIRGIKRSFQLRIMISDGRLWFAKEDVTTALGWGTREFQKAREVRLEGNSWGTVRSQWFGEGPSLLFISLTALTVVLAGRRARLNRAFLRWLDTLDVVEERGDAGEFKVYHSTYADHSVGAYVSSVVQHNSHASSIGHNAG